MHSVVLKTFDNYFSANIILTRLQDAGIECFLTDEFTSTIYPIFNTNANGGIKLVADASDELVAKKLLIEFENEYMKAAVCPVCGRNEFTLATRPSDNILKILLNKLFKPVPVESEIIYKCGHCTYECADLPLNSVSHN